MLSYWRFTGQYRSLLQITNANSESEKIKVIFSDNSTEIISFLNDQNEPQYYVEQIIRSIAMKYKEIEPLSKIFLSCKLWILELQWKDFDDEVTGYEIYKQIKSILSNYESVRDSLCNNRYVTYMFDYLHVIGVDIIAKHYKNKSYSLKNAVCEIMSHANYYKDVPAFLMLVTVLLGHEDNMYCFNQVSKRYMDEVLNVKIDTSIEQSEYFCLLGCIIERRTKNEKSKEWDIRMNKIFAKRYYEKSLSLDETNVTLALKIIELEVSLKCPISNMNNLYLEDRYESIYESLNCYAKTVLVEPCMYYGLYETLFLLGKLKIMKATTIEEQEDSISYFEEAKNMYLDVILPFWKCVLESNNNIQYGICIRLDILDLYTKLTSSYMQTYGVLSKTGNEYEMIYFEISNELELLSKK